MHLLNFSPLMAFYNPPPFLQHVGVITISNLFTVIFIPLFTSQLFFKQFTTLIRWNTVCCCTIQFSLSAIWWIINSATSFKGVMTFPVGHLITTPQLYENLEKYQPHAIRHKRVGYDSHSGGCLESEGQSSPSQYFQTCQM